MFQFAGTWEGTLKRYSAEGFIDGAGQSVALRVKIASNGDAQVYYLADGAWLEAKPGTFHAISWATQAIVTSADTGTDKDGTWVESWTFTLVRVDASTVQTYVLRAVNNLDMPLSNQHHHFAWGFSGVLRKVSDGT
jgi:hypothetical protein